MVWCEIMAKVKYTTQVKVLPDEISSSLTSFWLKRKLGDKYNPDDESILDPVIGWNRETIEPVFNRPGWYRSKTSCWYEIKLPSGRLVAVEDQRGKQYFDYHMKMLNAAEKPIPDSDWEAIENLLKRKVLEWTDRFRFERLRRGRVISDLSSKRRLLQFRKRVAKAIEERGIS